MRILTLGDSVNWGQGLLPENKFDRIVQQKIGAESTLETIAHSGAIIGIHTRDMAAANGEIPLSYPTIINQCEIINDPSINAMPDTKKIRCQLTPGLEYFIDSPS